MEYGKVLRFHRVKQGLTQNQLADGIISPAYLSKIENDQTVPAFEVLEHLYERLGLDFHDSSYHHPSKESLKEWYEMIVFKRKEEARELKEELIQQKDTLNNHHLYIFFELFRIRHLLLENEVEEAYEAWKNIRQHEDTFDDEMEYYFHLSSGLVSYYRGDFEDSYLKLMEAKNYSVSIDLEDWEESDLYYLLALSASQANNISASIFNADQALTIYQQQYNLVKSADCHILLGINYGRLKNYGKALENYHLVSKIATQTQDNYQLGLVYHNIGVIESRRGNFEAALMNYQKSLSYKTGRASVHEIFEAIYCLVFETYKIGRLDDCKKWISEGQTYLDSTTRDTSTARIHLNIYTMLINKDVTTAQYLENVAIPHFQEKKQHRFVIRYCMIVSDLLEAERSYKKSSRYLRLAIDLLNKYSNLGGMLL
ncbi:helix-turn-helix domain-containing protein [Halobacillus aidingensis]|uniref:Helix-turn-helix domain-containing protein n=1 Tax=Halobacillus aidingensis TaxID=240303 RepID=A0A1H0TYB2_HALAD|nr:helix-turn-helix transcriptional regulator [Halobacillus aidingensis]SDP58755.1 Helix-turn-helix domain-containing protein [Halobacillus aidingensis]